MARRWCGARRRERDGLTQAARDGGRGTGSEPKNWPTDLVNQTGQRVSTTIEPAGGPLPSSRLRGQPFHERFRCPPPLTSEELLQLLIDRPRSQSFAA